MVDTVGWRAGRDDDFHDRCEWPRHPVFLAPALGDLLGKSDRVTPLDGSGGRLLSRTTSGIRLRTVTPSPSSQSCARGSGRFRAIEEDLCPAGAWVFARTDSLVSTGGMEDGCVHDMLETARPVSVTSLSPHGERRVILSEDARVDVLPPSTSRLKASADSAKSRWSG